MNRSGGPVSSVLGFYKFTPAQMLVAHDEIDLPSGTVRLKESGGHGGHNGLRDIIAAQGGGFWRLRIGVGHPGTRNEVVDFVLTRAGADEQRVIDETIAAGADAIEEMFRSGAQIAMNKLHARAKPPPVKEPPVKEQGKES
jgi:PTH1 family peptidyl-tRNA hydrolase